MGPCAWGLEDAAWAAVDCGIQASVDRRLPGGLAGLRSLAAPGAGRVLLCSHRGRRYAALADLMAGSYNAIRSYNMYL